MTDGTYLANKIRARCTEDGDCLLWPGAMFKSGGGPLIQIGAKNLSARKIIWSQKRGAPFPSNRVASVTCLNKACLNENHVIAWTRTEVAQAWASQRNPTLAAAKLSNYRRDNQKNKLTAEDVALIRSTKGSRRELAEQYGVAITSIDRLRRGEGGWRDYSSPFAGLGARA
jgi:hypothetical protein